MSTSVIDYIFRDLAISYLKRTDLGQIKPDDLLSTATRDEGTREAEIRPGKVKPAAGFKPHGRGHEGHGREGHNAGTRDQGWGHGGSHGSDGNESGGSESAGQGAAGNAGLLSGLKTRTASRVISLPAQNEAFRIVQARIKGYEGDPCPVCGSFTLVRNGTCMKCDTCGGTTGCS
jgi:ribonucleoside-diphosphate reductase alpha chain